MPRRNITAIAQEVLEILKSSSSPLPVQDIASRTAMASDYEEAIAETQVALEQLHRRGFVYPVGGDFWGITRAGITGKPSYQRYLEIDPQQFFSNNFKEYFEHFKDLHPEYDKILSDIEKSPSNFRGFATDVWKIFAGEYESFQPTNKNVPKYVAPALISSIEQALIEELQEINKYHPQYRSKLPEPGAGYKAAQKAEELIGSRFPKDWVRIIMRQFAPGTAVSAESLLKAVSNYTNEFISSNPSGKDLIYKYVYQAFVRSSPPAKEVFFESIHSESEVVEALRQLVTARQAPAEILNSFRTSATKYSPAKVLSEVFNAADFSGGKDFSQVSFVEVKIVECNLTGAIFAGCDFTKATLNNNVLVNTLWKEASLERVKSFEDNNIDGADFADAGITRGFPPDSNTGTPKNLSFKEAIRDKEAIPAAVNTPVVRINTIVITEEEIPSAQNIAKALWGVLKGRDIFSSLKFQVVAAVSSEEATALREWLTDPNKVPSFIPSGKEAIDWFVSKNKAQEFTSAGFSKGDINKLFGRVRNFVEGPKKRPPTTPEEDPRIPEFIEKYKNASSIPTAAVLNLMSVQEGYLVDLLKSYGPDLSHQEMYSIVHALSNVLGQKHFAIRPSKWIQSFPHSATAIDLERSTRHALAGRGTQFSIYIQLNYSMMPNEIAQSASFAVEAGSTHITGAFAFSRIQPIAYTILTVDSKKPEVKSVWFISEMQNDITQKLDAEGLGGRGRSKSEEGKKIREYFKHWPEMLLNDIILKAIKAGVDEIWMPTGADVDKKTGGSDDSLRAEFWSKYYDRPAKAFGGVLKDVGVDVLLDPGSGYKMTSSKMYVIDLSQKKQSSLRLEEIQESSLLKLSVRIGNYDSEELKELADHHIHWIINNNRERFPDVEKYVTDEMMAQFAYDTFFSEYHVQRDAETEFAVAKLFEELGYPVYEPPYLDWLHWAQKAYDDVRFFVKNQKRISPDMAASDQELARDWFKLWQEETVPEDIKGARWYQTLFLPMVVALLKDKGYGDVTSTEYILPPPPEERTQQIINPTDTGEGEIVLEGEDILLPGEPSEELDLSFLEQEPLDKQKLIDKYLDMLADARAKNDQQAIKDAKEMLRRLSIASSLKLY